MNSAHYTAGDVYTLRRGARGWNLLESVTAMEAVLASALGSVPAGPAARAARRNTWLRLDPDQVSTLRDALTRLKRQGTRMAQEHSTLRQQAMTDSLTGMLNRRAFFKHSLPLRNACRQRHQALSCLMLDVDYFKSINDTDGHQRGDETLVLLARILQRSVRKSDVVCRYGGEEFAICMPAADAAKANDLAERLRRCVEDELGPRLALTARSTVTASIGVATSSDGHERLETLLAHADQAMYRAKQQGRNRVFAAGGER